jgi:NAD(P)-dependent dehydrogenase (short-subunit alcohol dehydrogenase family)
VQNLDPLSTKTAQGYEMNLGINCVGTFLFTKLLTPLLIATAQSEPANTVRVIWVSSSGTEFTAPKHIGIDMDNLDYKKKPESALVRYGLSKAGNWCQGVEFARRYKKDGVISIPLNPGNLASELYRDQGTFFKLASKLILYPSINGAYTELFAGLSSKITIEETGAWGKCSIRKAFWCLSADSS